MSNGLGPISPATGADLAGDVADELPPADVLELLPHPIRRDPAAAIGRAARGVERDDLRARVEHADLLRRRDQQLCVQFGPQHAFGGREELDIGLVPDLPVPNGLGFHLRVLGPERSGRPVAFDVVPRHLAHQPQGLRGAHGFAVTQTGNRQRGNEVHAVADRQQQRLFALGRIVAAPAADADPTNAELLHVGAVLQVLPHPRIQRIQSRRRRRLGRGCERGAQQTCKQTHDNPATPQVRSHRAVLSVDGDRHSTSNSAMDGGPVTPNLLTATTSSLLAPSCRAHRGGSPSVHSPPSMR